MSKRGHSPHLPEAVLELSLKNCHDASEQADLERYLARLPGVSSVHLDRTRALAHISFDPGQISAQDLRERLERGGYGCACQECAASVCQPGHPRVGSDEQ